MAVLSRWCRSPTDVLLGVLLGLLLTNLGSLMHTRHLSAINKETNQKLLCWVVTHPQTRERARRVYKTWGKRCDTLLFMSSQPDDELPVVALPLKNESRANLWTKATLTFRYLYKNHLDDYDWFFKADDDTYALIDNLKEYLATHNPSLPLFLGHEFPYDSSGKITFMSGGAGYVLSREAMRRLVEQGLDQNLCPHKSFLGEEDDIVITECLKRTGVQMPDTKDSMDNHRFLSCNVVQSFNNKVGLYDCQSTGPDRNCLSSRPFTFHYVQDTEMEAYEYLLYQAKVAHDP